MPEPKKSPNHGRHRSDPITDALRRQIAGEILTDALDPRARVRVLAQFSDWYLQELAEECNREISRLYLLWAAAKDGGFELAMADRMAEMRSVGGRMRAVLRVLRERNAAIPDLRLVQGSRAAEVAK